MQKRAYKLLAVVCEQRPTYLRAHIQVSPLEHAHLANESSLRSMPCRQLVSLLLPAPRLGLRTKCALTLHSQSQLPAGIM